MPFLLEKHPAISIERGPIMKNKKSKKAHDYQLPDNVAPVSYDIVLSPSLETRSVEGSEVIELIVREPTSSVTLNSKQLTILSASIGNGPPIRRGDGQGTGTRLIGSVVSDQEKELTTITFDGRIAPGKWFLHLRFVAQINDKLKGIYRSVDKTGGKVTELIATQFCATDARRAFPCFDEPELKATFALTLFVDRNATAISNTEVIVEDKIGNGEIVRLEHPDGTIATFGPLFGKKRVSFAPTMKISSYLPAFVVGRLESSESVTVNGTTLRVWSVPGKRSMTGFALEAARHALAFYEHYFDLPYAGGNKIDLIALPDHAYGAMENLGCITFREQALLIEPDTASHGELGRVAATVMHELAHMWFGDLVTMRWWNGIWLNEAFATFMEHLCLDDWKPEWRVWDEFALGKAEALKIDALASTHPIESPVSHPDEASELFDVISYEKGCAVLHQLHEFIGGGTFRKGIIAYLKEHAYGSTETYDLWDALESACITDGLQVPVREIMDAWVLTPGHPIVSVSKSRIKGCIEMEQRRFTLSESADQASLLAVPLIIRIGFSDGSTSTRKVLLDSSKKTVFVGARDDIDYVVVNAGGSGFYRVTYEEDLASTLARKAHHRLSSIERFNLLNDSWFALLSGAISSPAYLDLIRRFKDETEPQVWRLISSSLEKLKGLVDDGKLESMEQMIAALASPCVERLGWQAKEGESSQDRQVRGIVLRIYGTNSNDPKFLARARGVLDAWKASERSVDAEVLDAALTIVAEKGAEREYAEFADLAARHTTAQVRDRFLEALTRFKKEELLTRTVDKIKLKEIRPQDAPRLLDRLFASRKSAHLAWQLIEECFDELAAALPEPVMIRICRGPAGIDDEELAQKAGVFLSSRRFKAGAMAIAQSMELASVNVAMRKREKPALASSLAG